jgi:hypothetical protein
MIPQMHATATLTLDTTVRASEDQISCDVADEVVLLSVQDGQYYGLNPVGAAIWRMIGRPCPLREVRDQLLTEFDGVSLETCTAEVIAFATSMRALGLIEIE